MKQEVETAFGDEILFSDLLDLIISNKTLILITVSITTTIALINAIVTPPVFKATSVITKSVNKTGQSLSSGVLSNFGGFAEIAGINLPSTNTDTGLAILRSNIFKTEFIKENDLLPILFADDWDKNKMQWKDGEPPTLWSAVRLFNASTNISVDPDGLINITVEWNDPEIVADWANKMVVAINNRLRNDAISEAEKSLEFLEKEMTNTANTRLQSILSALMQEQKENMMLANVREEYEFKIIDPAVIPEVKSGPNRRGMVFLGFIIGLLGSIFYIFLRSYLISPKPE